MSRYHGITENTYKRFVIDSGAVRRGYVSEADRGDLIGATRGGSTFTIEQEIREMPVDGAKGPVKGGRRITRVNVKLVANFIEWSTDMLLSMLPGSTESLSTDHDEITRDLQLSDSDYLSNVVIIGEVSDSSAAGPAILMVRNAIVDSSFEAALVDADETGLSVTFTGHFTTTDLDTEPWKILWPHDSNPTTTTAGA